MLVFLEIQYYFIFLSDIYWCIFVKVGSFLMGWFGIVFKAHISCVSDQLAMGLSTGYLGSLTTFSGWNQKMVELSAEGKWAFAVLGYFVGKINKGPVYLKLSTFDGLYGYSCLQCQS